MNTSRLTKWLGVCTWFVVFQVGRATTSEAAAKTDEVLLIEAIHSLENPRNLTSVGRRGELGPYQFRPATWRMHTAKPFEMAKDHKTATDVALLHSMWIRRGLVKAGMEPTVYNVALAWNAGLEATIKGKATRVSHQYAQRAQNLVDDFCRIREKEAAEAAAAQPVVEVVTAAD